MHKVKKDFQLNKRIVMKMLRPVPNAPSSFDLAPGHSFAEISLQDAVRSLNIDLMYKTAAFQGINPLPDYVGTVQHVLDAGDEYVEVLAFLLSHAAELHGSGPIGGRVCWSPGQYKTLQVLWKFRSLWKNYLRNVEADISKRSSCMESEDEARAMFKLFPWLLNDVCRHCNSVDFAKELLDEAHSCCKSHFARSISAELQVAVRMYTVAIDNNSLELMDFIYSYMPNGTEAVLAQSKRDYKWFAGKLIAEPLTPKRREVLDKVKIQMGVEADPELSAFVEYMLGETDEKPIPSAQASDRIMDVLVLMLRKPIAVREDRLGEFITQHAGPYLDKKANGNRYLCTSRTVGCFVFSECVPVPSWINELIEAQTA